MHAITRRAIAAGVGAAALSLSAGTMAEAKDSFRIAWSIYVGWMPWPYAEDTGIMDKWADKYGIDVEIVQVNEYIESINQYTAGAFDGVVLTNMDALTIPATGGVDTTAVIIGDFSNGNDGIVSKNGDGLADLAGETVNLVQFSVSHYLLARALEEAGLSERDLTLENTSDADIVSIYKASERVDTVVTWNPLLTEIMAEPGATLVYDSSDIPGEIIDMLALNTGTLEDNPDLAKALAGAWYEVMSIMSRDDDAGREARGHMAAAAGTTLERFDSQLETTRMFFDPQAAVDFTRSPDLKATMDSVRNFTFEQGLLGVGASSPDAVGIVLPDGTVLGDPNNVNLRFTDEFMAMAAEGRL